tara:strand:+ start:303 stop:575 length:273 start_codon:yes stop_codon:yes gene_type:complete
MENTKSNLWEPTFIYFILIVGVYCFGEWSDYTVWQAVYWILGLGFGFCFLGAMCGASTNSPLLNLENEIAELELEIKKAELQKELTRLSN